MKNNENTLPVFENEYGNKHIIRMEYIVKKYITNLQKITKLENKESIYGHDILNYIAKCMEFVIGYNNSRNFYTLFNEDDLAKFWLEIRNNESGVYNFIIHCSAEFRLAYTREEYDEIIDRLSDAFSLNQGLVKENDTVMNRYNLSKDNLNKLFKDNVWVVGLIFICLMDPLV